MLDLKLIKEETEKVRAALLKRMSPENLDLESIIQLDDSRRTVLQSMEEKKSERNRSSKEKPSPETIARMKALGEEIKIEEEKLNKIEEELKEKISALPNLPADDVVAGGKENNKVVYTFGEKPKFNFQPKDHVELATELGLIDYHRAAKMSGSPQ